MQTEKLKITKTKKKKFKTEKFSVSTVFFCVRVSYPATLTKLVDVWTKIFKSTITFIQNEKPIQKQNMVVPQ